MKVRSMVSNWLILNLMTISFLTGVMGGRSKRIVGGMPVHPPFRYQWMVAIFRYGDYKCGGTLITPKLVLTAAHCFSGTLAPLEHYTVGVHRHDLALTSDQEEGALEFKVEQRWVHPEYNADTKYNDLAIVRLNITDNSQRPISTNGNGDMGIQLATRADEPHPKELSIIGWGAQAERKRPSPILLEAMVDSIAQGRCEKAYLEAETYAIMPSQICAGGGLLKRDACDGDSGGPMFYRSATTGKYVLVGVTSTGHACADPKVPGIYMRVSSYADWISKVIKLQVPPTLDQEEPTDWGFKVGGGDYTLAEMFAAHNAARKESMTSPSSSSPKPTFSASRRSSGHPKRRHRL